MTKHLRLISVVALTACAHSARVPVEATAPVPSPASGDWPTFNRTLAGDRFSPLTEIDRSNVAVSPRVCQLSRCPK